MYVCACVRVSLCVCIFVNVYFHAYICVCMHICVHVCSCKYTDVCEALLTQHVGEPQGQVLLHRQQAGFMAADQPLAVLLHICEPRAGQVLGTQRAAHHPLSLTCKIGDRQREHRSERRDRQRERRSERRDRRKQAMVGGSRNLPLI